MNSRISSQVIGFLIPFRLRMTTRIRARLHTLHRGLSPYLPSLWA